MTLPQPPSGRFDGNQHLFAVRVYFEDTDLSGVVYHANYLRWFERARSDMLRLLGIDQRAAHEADEGAYAVSALDLRYLRPAKLDDAIQEMLDYDGPVIFDCLVEKHENCFPMIPSGKAHNEMLLGDVSTKDAIDASGSVLV